MRLPASPCVDPAVASARSRSRCSPRAGARAGQAAPDVPAAIEAPDAAETRAPSKVPLDEIRRYVAVYNAVKEAYVEPVDDKKLMQSAIRGLLFDLDPHSVYLDKRDARGIRRTARAAPTTASASNCSASPTARLRVIAPIDDTPAARAGIKAGDMITAIDGKPFKPDEGDSSGPLRGEPGSKVVLTIVREGKPKPFDVTLTRETIRIASVRSRMLEPGYGYLRISTVPGRHRRRFRRASSTSCASRPAASCAGLVHRPAQQPRRPADRRRCRSPTSLLEKGKIVSTARPRADQRCRVQRDAGRPHATARRWWCWSTPVRPARRKCWPARCATTSARASSAAAPSARARCRPCCRWTTATRSSSPPRAITRPAASRSRRCGIVPDVVLHAAQGRGQRRSSPDYTEASLPRPPAWRRRRSAGRQRRRSARRRRADHGGVGTN